MSTVSFMQDHVKLFDSFILDPVLLSGEENKASSQLK